MKGMKRFIIEIPDISPFKGNDFFKHYDLEVNAYYRIDDKRPNRENYGPSSEKVCAICNRKKPEVTFKTESHILPAGLGNNKYFSNEECDSCNSDFSEEHEGSLATMLGFYRAVRGVRGRKKGGAGSKRNDRKIHTPILKLKDEGEIYYDEVEQTVKMVMGENGDYQIEKGEKSLKIKIPVPKYKPGLTFVSLFKSVWLLMSEQQRAECTELKEFLDGSKDNLKLPYYSLFVPGTGHPIVELNLYKRKKVDGTTPKFVLTFSFLNHVLIWCSTDSDSPVFPPLDFLESNLKGSQVTMRKYDLPNLHYEFGGTDEQHEFGFENIVEGKPEEIDDLASTSPRREYVAPNAIITARFAGESIKCRIRIERFDNDCFSFKLSGAEFGAEIFFEEFKKFNKINTGFSLNLTSVEIKDAIKTVNFIKHVKGHDGNLELLGLQDGSIFFEAHDFNFNNIADETIEKWLNLSRLIDVINDEYGFDLRYPANIRDDELHDLRLIGNGILHGQFRENQDEDGAIHVTANREWLGFMLEAYDKGELPMFSASRNFSFLNKTVGPVEIKVIPIEPRFEPDIPELRKFANSDGDKSESLELTIVTKSVLYEFGDWYKSPTESTNK